MVYYWWQDIISVNAALQRVFDDWLFSGQIQARHCPPTAQEGRSRQGSAQELPAGIQSTILVQIAGEGDTKAAATFFECSQHDADTPVGIQALL